ncbi:glycosyl transferase [Sulfurimicrobium lacus]|uniref:Glycosyl transferase n=1 Tax=Sulfurimicrobium lacus TaxID=2715678 RepID=A0A6F8VG90_9PROT|nr:glycosyltransferase family 4 protein [Sulfurimicrobium lacus]BCB28694.1 glycosyl transferase [Sulfurimicrobium lacus]
MTAAKLHIVHTEASLGWGGQEIRILTEAAGMIQRGHQVTLLCPPQARIYSEAQSRGLPVVALPIGRKNLRGVLALRRWLKTHAVDVINTHSSTDAWLAALAMKSLGKRVPIVRTRHISAPIPHNPATRWLYQRASHHIVTTGERLREQLIGINRFSPTAITSVPTGVDTAHFVPGDKAAVRQQLGLPLDAPIVGIVATLRSWKGHRYLVEAFAALPDTTRLLIVGDGPVKEALLAQIAQLGIADRVVLPGNQRDVLPWLQAMDVFALPSYANEGVPQAILQAMLCGLPIISTPVGSILEAVEHERTGLIVEPQNSAELQHAIQRLLGDADLRQKLGSAARERALARFGFEAMVERMEGIFRNVTENV